MMQLSRVLLSLSLLLTGGSAFGVPPPTRGRRGSRTVSTRAFLSKAAAVTESPADRYFNLEELEDKDKCVTEVYLNADGTVKVGETDGPPVLEAAGTWACDSQSGAFTMALHRTYGGGAPGTDMGEFRFAVDRTFTGSLYRVGAKLAVEGSLHAVDEHGDGEVGFFEMLDVTSEREGRKEDIFGSS